MIDSVQYYQAFKAFTGIVIRGNSQMRIRVRVGICQSVGAKREPLTFLTGLDSHFRRRLRLIYKSY